MERLFQKVCSINGSTQFITVATNQAMSSVAKTPLLTREKYSELGKTINVFDAYDLVHIQE